MARKVAATKEETAVLNSVELEAEEFESVESLGGPTDTEGQFGPPMHSPEWQPWLATQFQPSELDPEGRPFVAGLRRVARKVLGPIIYSGPEHYTSTSYRDEKSLRLAPVTVKYVVRLMWCRPEDTMGGAPFVCEFSDLADVWGGMEGTVWVGNIDRQFSVYPSATCATRAEARVMRKALQLKGIAAEEACRVPLGESRNGFITQDQIDLIDIICQRNNIDVNKFINAGKERYANIERVPYDVAEMMCEHLNDMQTGAKKIPDSLRGSRAAP